MPDERMRALSCREQTFSSTCNVEASQERFCVLCGRSWNDFASFEPSRTSFSKHVLTLRRPIDEFARVPSTLFQACSNVEACQGRVCERCGATESGTSPQINRNQRRSAGINATQARFGSGRTKFLSKGLSIGLVLLYSHTASQHAGWLSGVGPYTLYTLRPQAREAPMSHQYAVEPSAAMPELCWVASHLVQH